MKYFELTLQASVLAYFKVANRRKFYIELIFSRGNSQPLNYLTGTSVFPVKKTLTHLQCRVINLVTTSANATKFMTLSNPGLRGRPFDH